MLHICIQKAEFLKKKNPEKNSSRPVRNYHPILPSPSLLHIYIGLSFWPMSCNREGSCNSCSCFHKDIVYLHFVSHSPTSCSRLYGLMVCAGFSVEAEGNPLGQGRVTNRTTQVFPGYCRADMLTNPGPPAYFETIK